MRLKLLITSRPESDIQSSLCGIEKQLQVNWGKVNPDLSKFIDFKVGKLSRDKGYPPKLTTDVRSTLTTHAGGTFLWASLVLNDLSETRRLKLVSEKLQSLPSGIDEVYDKILSQVEPDCRDIAKIIFRWVVLARRPLTVEELAMALALATDEYGDMLPTDEDLDFVKGDFRCCEPLIYLDTSTNTLHLVHQSAKDYLLGSYLQANASLSYYRIKEAEAHLFIFQTCWRYLNVDEFGHGSKIIKRDGDRLYQITISGDYFDAHKFLRYAVEEWQEHALAAYCTLLDDFEWNCLNLRKALTLRDTWFIRAASNGQETVVRGLLEKGGANPDSKDRYGRTPLSFAAEGGHIEVVKVLLATAGVDPNSKDKYGQTPLLFAIERGHVEVVKVLLAIAGVDPNSKDKYGQTPLSFAAEREHVEVVKVLLAIAGIDPNSKDVYGQTPLSLAAAEGRVEVVKVLLATAGVDPNSKDKDGQTPLFYAIAGGHVEVVKVLLATAGVDPNSKDKDSQTPLSLAIAGGHIEIVTALQSGLTKETLIE